MRNYLYLLSVLLMSLSFVSCDDDDDNFVPNVEVTLNFSTPQDIQQYNPSILGLESLKLTEINTGKVTSVVSPSTRAANSNLSITVSVPEGLYTIDMESAISYEVEKKTIYTKMRAHQESIEIKKAAGTTTVAPIDMKSFVYNPGDKNGGFVIAEIFFTGTETPEGKQYNGDKYFRIYNNSGDTLCADGLTIIESAFQTVTKQAYTPDIMNEAFSGRDIYRIPLGGNLMVAPGESLLLCDIAINHKEANTNSFDLTKADFEWYDESTNSFTDTDNENVPNMEKIYSPTLSVWAPHNRGFHSYVLCRLGGDFDHQLSAEEFLDKYYYEYSYDFVYPGGVIPMKNDAYKIPNSWVLDAVNLSIESKFQWIVTDPSLDMGWTYCGKVDSDKTRYGKSVRRKVLAGKILQDTNNSSVDFMPEQPADPYYKFHD